MSHFAAVEWEGLRIRLSPAGWRHHWWPYWLPWPSGAELRLRVSVKRSEDLHNVPDGESLYLHLAREGMTGYLGLQEIISTDKTMKAVTFGVLTYEGTYRIDALNHSTRRSIADVMAGPAVIKRGVAGIHVKPNYLFYQWVVAVSVGLLAFVLGGQFGKPVVDWLVRWFN